MDFAMILKQGEKDYTSDFVAAAEDGDCHCFVAADGRDSSDAAKMAAETVVEEFKKLHGITKETGAELFNHADSVLKDVQPPANACMAFLLTDGAVALWGNIGDCRVYLLRENLLYEITPDHSGAYALYEAGEIRYPKIRKNKTRYDLSRMLGSGFDVQGDFSQPEVIRKGDSFLVCTDGFWSSIHERQIEKCLKKSKNAKDWLDKMTAIVERNIKHKKYSRFKDSLGAITIKM